MTQRDWWRFLIEWDAALHKCKVIGTYSMGRPVIGNATFKVIEVEAYDRLKAQLKVAMTYVGVGLDDLDKKDALREIRLAGK